MKILIVISNTGIGGSQRVAINLSRWINEQHDARAKIVALKKSKGQNYDMQGIDYIELSGRNIIFHLRKIIGSFNPDVMLSMGVPMSIYTVPASWFSKVKHVISERNDPNHFSGKAITKVISRMLFRTADGFVFQTSDARDYYKLPNHKITAIIPNPILKLDEISKYNRVDNRDKVIVSVGRLIKQKNHKLLIEAFSEIKNKFPEYKLIIWGEGSERVDLEKSIRELNLLDSVFLPGANSNIIEAIHTASIFVLSSEYEGMPNALMEAMALGIPCISSNCPCGGPRELISDGVNGYLFPVNNKKELVKKMMLLLGSEETQIAFSQNARIIRERYSDNVVCKKWMTLFEEVI